MPPWSRAARGPLYEYIANGAKKRAGILGRLEEIAGKRRERGCSFAKVISTFHLPMRFGDWASGKAENDAFIANTRINARVAFTFFSNPNLVSRQDTFLGLLAGAQCILA